MATRKEYLDSILEAAVRLKHFPDEVVFIDDLQRIDRMPPERQVSAYDFPAFSAARERRTRGH